MSTNRNRVTRFDLEIAAQVRAEIARRCTSRSAIAHTIGMPKNVFYRKSLGQVALTLGELQRIAAALDMTVGEITEAATRRMTAGATDTAA